jgi:hypothetical protein
MNALARALWIRLPVAAGTVSRTLTVVLSDGCYLVRWPAVALLGPPIAVLYGVALSQTRSPEQLTYTYSLLALVPVVVLASLGAALGLLATLGYAVCDFLLFDHPSQLATLRPALLVSYLLLAVLTVLTPLAAGLVRRRTLPHPERLGVPGHLLDVALAALILGGLVFLWTESSAVLIRPIFVWTEAGTPTDDAIHPLQQFGVVLALVAAGAGALRVELETRAGPEAAVAVGQGLRQLPARRLPAPVSAAIDGLLLTFLVGGLLDSWLEVPLVLAAMVGISLVRRVGPGVVPLWPRVLSPIPMVLRVLAGVVATAFLGQAIISTQFLATQSLWPVAAAAVVGMVVMTALVPDIGMSRDQLRGAR